MDWIGLSSVLRPRQHSIGYMGDGFYRFSDIHAVGEQDALQLHPYGNSGCQRVNISVM